MKWLDHHQDQYKKWNVNADGARCAFLFFNVTITGVCVERNTQRCRRWPAKCFIQARKSVAE
jgi:hypothetical protein